MRGGLWYRWKPETPEGRAIMRRLIDRELGRIEAFVADLKARDAARAVREGAQDDRHDGDDTREERPVHTRHWIKDSADGLIYAGEFDGGNVVGLAGPIPWHEVGKVMLGRYSYAPDRAAEMNGRDYQIMGQAEIHAISQGYTDRRGMPVLDGTTQDATQPEALPARLPGPNPPELGDKEHPHGLVGSTEHPDLSIGDQEAMVATDNRKGDADAPIPSEEAPRTDAERAEVKARREGEGEGDVDPGAIDATLKARAGISPEAEDAPPDQRDVADSEQYAPREGANLKDGADQRRAAELQPKTRNSQDEQDGAHTADPTAGAAGTTGTSGRPAATRARATRARATKATTTKARATREKAGAGKR